MIIKPTCTPYLFSGSRFSVTYRIGGSEKAARVRAEDIRITQRDAS